MIEQYYRFREQLEPEEIIFDPLETPLLPEDPDWPTPTTSSELWALLKEFPRKVQVLCGLVAADRAFPVFRSAFPQDKLGPALLKATHDWVQGQVTEKEMTPLRQQFDRRMDETEEDMRLDSDDPHGHLSDRELQNMSAADAIYYCASGASLSGADTLNDVATLIDIAVERAAFALGENQWVAHQWASPEFMRWWWSECRRKLAFRDAFSIELAGRKTLGALQSYQKKGIANLTYDVTKRRLEEPEPTVYYPTGQPLMPEDPDWKTPVTLNDLERIFKQLDPQLSANAAAIAGLTAAEMVLPNIARVYPDWTVAEDGVQLAWDALRKEVTGSITTVNLGRIVDAIRNFYENIPVVPVDEAAQSATYATVSARQAIQAVQRIVGHPIFEGAFGQYQVDIVKDRALSAVLNAAWSGIEIDAPRMIRLDFSQFLRTWWSKVRRRLAVRDIEEFELD